jgi:hypothetical protein
MTVPPRRRLRVVAAPQPLSTLVDGAWYLAAYPDIAAAGIDPVGHYLNQGWREQRCPNLYFDTAWFLSEHPDISPDIDPLVTYLQDGERLGWSPSRHFDLLWYQATYDPPPGESALGHYLRHRTSGTVSPNPNFDPAYYLRQNTDVARAGLDPYAHYWEVGRDEGRMPRPPEALVQESGLFDENYYLINSADIQEAGLDPVQHFCSAGWREGRKPSPYFDPAWYMKRYLPQAPVNPLLHYILGGEAEGCRPSPYFDPAWYSRHYGVTTPLRHYLEHRRTQKFSPLPCFDVEFYLRTYAETIRPNRDPFMHYLAVGGARNFNPSAWFNAAAYRQMHMQSSTEFDVTDPAYDNPLMDFMNRIVLAR